MNVLSSLVGKTSYASFWAKMRHWNM